MKPSEALMVYRDEIRRVVSENHACNPRVFGSVLHGQDTENSDIDLLVDPTPKTTLMDLARIQGHLQKCLGVPVDVLTPKSLPVSFRARILGEAKPI